MAGTLGLDPETALAAWESDRVTDTLPETAPWPAGWAFAARRASSSAAPSSLAPAARTLNA
jgi:hypothetical protein